MGRIRAARARRDARPAGADAVTSPARPAAGMAASARWATVAALAVAMMTACAPVGDAAPAPGSPAGAESPGATDADTPTAAPTPAAQTPAGEAPVGSAPLDDAALDVIAHTRVFFGHRSVGGDIMELGVPAVYASFGRERPPTSDTVTGDAQGWFDDTWLAQDADPLTGVRDFDTRVRSGINVDVAFMKVGYIDITEQIDVAATFEAYRTLMADLESDFPDIAFLHVTVSPTRWNPWNNAAIERYNTLVRTEYDADGRLFDLAGVLSTCPGGARDAAVTDDGQPYRMLCEEYTRDGGHLNELGATVAAAEMLRVIALVG